MNRAFNSQTIVVLYTMHNRVRSGMQALIQSASNICCSLKNAHNNGAPKSSRYLCYRK